MKNKGEKVLVLGTILLMLLLTVPITLADTPDTDVEVIPDETDEDPQQQTNETKEPETPKPTPVQPTQPIKPKQKQPSLGHGLYVMYKNVMWYYFDGEPHEDF